MNSDIALLHELGGESEAADYSPLASKKIVTPSEKMETQKKLGELVTLLNVSRRETPEDDGEKDGVQHTATLDEMQRLSSVMPAELVSVFGSAKRDSTDKNANGDAVGLMMQRKDLRGALEWQQKESARKLVQIRKALSTNGTCNGDKMDVGGIRSEEEDIKCLSSLMPIGIFNIKSASQADDDKKPTTSSSEEKPLFDASEVDIDEEDFDVSPETDELGTSSQKRASRRRREGGQRSRTSRSPRRCDSTDEAKSSEEPGSSGSRQRISASRKTSPRRTATDGGEPRNSQPISRSQSFDGANCKPKSEGEEESAEIKHRVSEGTPRSPRRNKSSDEALSRSSHRAGGSSRSPRRQKSTDESLTSSSHRAGGNSRSPRRHKSRDESLSSSSHRGGGNSRSPRRQKGSDESLTNSSHGARGNTRSPQRHKSRNAENPARELQDESMCSSTHSPRAENKTRIRARRNNSRELKDESMSSSPRGASRGGDNPIRGRRSRGARGNCNRVELGHLQLQQALQNRSEDEEKFHQDEPEEKQAEEEVAPEPEESMEQERKESTVGAALFAPAKLAAGFALSASRAATNAASTAGQTAFNVASTAKGTAMNAATTAGSKAFNVASTAGTAMNSATTAGSKALNAASTAGTRAIAVATSTAHIAAAAATTTAMKKN